MWKCDLACNDLAKPYQRGAAPCPSLRWPCLPGPQPCPSLYWLYNYTVTFIWSSNKWPKFSHWNYFYYRKKCLKNKYSLSMKYGYTCTFNTCYIENISKGKYVWAYQGALLTRVPAFSKSLLEWWKGSLKLKH